MTHSYNDPSGAGTCGTMLRAAALAASVFGAALFGMGRHEAQAQSLAALQTEIALTLPQAELTMSTVARAEVQAALQRLDAEALALVYARLCATFRYQVGADDLSVARALVDYALLAESELEARGLRRPGGTQSAREMLMTWELVL